MSRSPDTPRPGCWPCFSCRRGLEKITLPPIAGAMASGKKDSKTSLVPKPPQTQHSEKLIKNLEKQRTRPSRKLKKAGIEVAADVLQAKSSGLGWGLVQQGSSTLTLPVLERPESRFSSAERVTRIETTNERLALAERIRQKEIKANQVRQQEIQKKLSKAREARERSIENKERKYTNTLLRAHLAPSDVEKRAHGGYSYSLQDTRPVTPAHRPTTDRLYLKALDIEEERETYRARLMEKQKRSEAARQRKLQKKVEKARESSVNAEHSRERRQNQERQRRQVKQEIDERLTTADSRRETLLNDRQYQAHQEIERARKIAEKKRELETRHHQIQMDMALRNPENVDALASRDEILEAVYSDFWDQ